MTIAKRNAELIDMGDHDRYGKDLLRRVLGSRFDPYSADRNLPLGSISISLDGVIKSKDLSRTVCAVEIEARNEFQIRGAVLNLYLHPAPSALLILMASNLHHHLPDVIQHVQELWRRLTRGERGELPVAVLFGEGGDPAYGEDQAVIRDVLHHMRILP